MTAPRVELEGTLQRFREMGIDAHPMRGGRCVLASLRFGPAPFPTLSGPLRIARVVFASVGTGQIKCLRPRALFQLPILRIADCADAVAVESRIRDAWREHLCELRRTSEHLVGLGARPAQAEQGSVLTLPLEGEPPGTRVTLVDRREAILPSAGLLSGIALGRPEDRKVPLDPGLESSIDLELWLASRLEALAKRERSTASRERWTRSDAPHPDRAEPQQGGAVRGRGRILLVGPHLARERTCIESLRFRGYSVTTAHSESQALDLFGRASFELVLVDAKLGRGEGLELIPALRRLAGLEDVPVLLVDEALHPSRRDTARSAGAAGYVVHPIDVARIADSLGRLVNGPPRRRFSRYPERLSVRLDSSSEPCLVTSIGRGGAFLMTDASLPTGTLRRCELSIPGWTQVLRVDSEVLYRLGGASAQLRGVGVRFRGFPADDEPRFIEFLQSLEDPPPSAG